MEWSTTNAATIVIGLRHVNGKEKNKIAWLVCYLLIHNCFQTWTSS